MYEIELIKHGSVVETHSVGSTMDLAEIERLAQQLHCNRTVLHRTPFPLILPRFIGFSRWGAFDLDLCSVYQAVSTECASKPAVGKPLGARSCAPGERQLRKPLPLTRGTGRPLNNNPRVGSVRSTRSKLRAVWPQMCVSSAYPYRTSRFHKPSDLDQGITAMRRLGSVSLVALDPC
jgi:hypothetical protein